MNYVPCERQKKSFDSKIYSSRLFLQYFIIQQQKTAKVAPRLAGARAALRVPGGWRGKKNKKVPGPKTLKWFAELVQSEQKDLLGLFAGKKVNSSQDDDFLTMQN